MENYLKINKDSWNQRVDGHLKSEFYDLKSFIKGQTSLKSIELDLFGNLEGKKVLHLQCHFGQDTLSLQRMGAHCVGVDLSDKAIDAAQKLNDQLGLKAEFICSDIYDLPTHLSGSFDYVFTSYGTIGWLPDLNKWSQIIQKYLKPGGAFIFAEFHPVLWMYDDNFSKIDYSYFNTEEIVEQESGSYADTQGDYSAKYVCWNHSLADVLQNLILKGFSIKKFQEFNYSPYNCFKGMVEIEKDKFQIKGLEDKLPMVYALKAILNNA